MTGIAVWNFRRGTTAERISRFAELGFEAVSLLPDDAVPMCRGERPEIDEAVERHSLGVTVHGGMAGSSGLVDESRLLSEFESYLDWHGRTGRLVSVSYDAASEKTGNGVRYRHAEMVPVLRRMLEMSAGSGITVGVEDWPRDAAMYEQAQELPEFGHYGILIDLGHMNIRIANDSPGSPYPADAARAYLEAIALPINELHIHNNDGARDLHAPVESGTADLGAVWRMLAPRCARTVLTFEVAPAMCGVPEWECVRSCAEAIRDWRW